MCISRDANFSGVLVSGEGHWHVLFVLVHFITRLIQNTYIPSLCGRVTLFSSLRVQITGSGAIKVVVRPRLLYSIERISRTASHSVLFADVYVLGFSTCLKGRTS